MATSLCFVFQSNAVNKISNLIKDNLRFGNFLIILVLIILVRCIL